MRTLSKLTYWALGIIGTAVWTSAIISTTSLPLPAQLVLGSMGLVACVWGAAVLFPKDRPVSEPTAPGRMTRDQAMEAAASQALPLGNARVPVSRIPVSRIPVGRPGRNPGPPPGDLPPLLRTPFEEAARMEAHRLAEAITAAGLFGAVNVRLDADGMALVSPVRTNDGVRVPIATVVRFASYAAQPDGLANEGRSGAGTWPGRDLQAAMDAHLAAIAPPEMPNAVPSALSATQPLAPPPGWANPLGHLTRPA